MSRLRDPADDGVLERRTTPAGELVLRRRAGELEIVLDGMFLMSTACRDSERALARLALDRVTKELTGPLRVLVGGLGAGHTLAATLEEARVTEVVVVELLPEIGEWARSWLAATAGRALDDPRVELEIGDVGRHLRAHPGRYHAVLLDVDNGPSWTARPENAALYGEGLVDGLGALVPGGTLATWSAQAEPGLAAAVTAAGHALGCRTDLTEHAIEVRLADAVDQRRALDWVYLIRSTP